MQSHELAIAGRRIGRAHAPYIVAEISANHNGNLASALSLIDAAKAAGADAVKIQTYRPDTITLDSDAEDFRITEGLWKGRTLYDLYEEAHTPWEWHAELFDYARQAGITIFSSPFDHTAVDLLEELGAPAYKIASFEAVDTPLIEYVARTGKPMIISTGMADESEIQDAVDAARGAGCEELALLQCVSGYPSPASEYNLHTMVDMQRRYNTAVGLSDHTLDDVTAIASVALGACIVEKHFTLDRAGGGPDDSFSLEPEDLRKLCQDCSTAWKSLGGVNYGRASSERGNAQFRRSLYFTKDLAAGEIITEDAVRSVRPGYGLAPKYLKSVVGKMITQRVQKNSPVYSESIEGFDPV